MIGQAGREGWSDERIDDAIEQAEEHEEKYMQSFDDAVREVEAREQREYLEWRRRECGEYDSEAEEQTAMVEESDSDDEARPFSRTH